LSWNEMTRIWRSKRKRVSRTLIGRIFLTNKMGEIAKGKEGKGGVVY
jgi:hypothetical protein